MLSDRLRKIKLHSIQDNECLAKSHPKELNEISDDMHLYLQTTTKRFSAISKYIIKNLLLPFQKLE